MKIRAAIAAGLAAALSAGAGLPTVKGQPAVATVNDEPVTLSEMMERLGSLHQDAVDPAAAPAHPDPMLVLQRIIDARLVVQEAKSIGLDRQPEVIDRLAAARLALLKSGVARNAVKGITAADPADVEKAYRDRVREQNLALVVFRDEEAARSFVTTIAGGADFDAQGKRAQAERKASRVEPAQFVRAADLQEEVREATAGLGPGAVSAPFRLADGFAVVKCFGVRYPDDPAARSGAAEAALRAKKEQRIQQYTDDLRKRDTHLHRDVLGGLDYHAKSPGFDALRKDLRVVADIQGGKPVTVKDLTERIEQTFYHGVQQAIDRQRINPEIPTILDRLMMERVLEVEAKRLGVERQDTFLSGMKEQTDSILFDAFVKKVVDPSVTLSEPELLTYYNEHKGDFSTPEMLRLESVSFARRDDARAALDRLRQGADPRWLKANAAGQVKDAADGRLPADGSLVATASLPEPLQKAIAGAGEGEARLAGDEPGPYDVLVVRQKIPSAPRAYGEVREQVASKVFGARRKASLDDWVAKLRARSTIVIHARPDELKGLLGLGAPAGR
ncbi:MAG TPA: peptidyl-prolyl cis-trans isomerase [Candidatus Polarisedimenticolia bacterium]|jgi:parvulin-like peptidyl-prolyl isomerase|nr:peptidyl-prolyl cis-trans isomerase [Candidatus Polarisedimenticolia bacterium]